MDKKISNFDSFPEETKVVLDKYINVLILSSKKA